MPPQRPSPADLASQPPPPYPPEAPGRCPLLPSACPGRRHWAPLGARRGPLVLGRRVLLPAGGPWAAPHLRGTWHGGTAPSSCPWLPGGRRRRSWGRHGPGGPRGPQSSISCRSWEGTMGQGPGLGHAEGLGAQLLTHPCTDVRPLYPGTAPGCGEQWAGKASFPALSRPGLPADKGSEFCDADGQQGAWNAVAGRHCGLHGARGQVRPGGCWVFSGLQTSRWTQWEQRWLKQLGAQGRSLWERSLTRGRGQTQPGRWTRAGHTAAPWQQSQVGLRQQHLQNSVTESSCIRGPMREKREGSRKHLEREGQMLLLHLLAPGTQVCWLEQEQPNREDPQFLPAGDSDQL